MNLNEIYWHDSLILGVCILPEKDLVEMRLLYPEDWGSNTYAEKTIVFENSYGYKEFHGPFLGAPTILSANVVGSHEEWLQLRIETNAGHCEIYFKEVHFK